jgi:hypothetical protein
MDQRREREQRKRHGSRPALIRAASRRSIHAERERAHHHADERDAEVVARTHQACSARARRLPHLRRIARVDSKRDARRGSSVVALPDDFVAEGFPAEYLVEYHLGVMAHMPVEMYVEGRRLGEEFTEGKGGLIEPLQIAIELASPPIAVSALP